MLFTVIIATCGRPERLKRNLEAVRRAVDAAGGRHRLIVADNGPAYSAESVVNEFAGSVSWPVRYLKTEPLNKTKALNAAIRVADTEWFAFTDDDTVPDPDWLRQAANFTGQNDCPMFGGRIVPGNTDTPLPWWLRPGKSGRFPYIIGVYVKYEPLARSGTIEGSMMAPFGANVFVKRDLFGIVGEYDENLWDLCRRCALGVEDSEFGHRLKRRGYRIGYCHEAVVVHPVHHDRCTLWQHIRFAYYFGWREPIVFPEENKKRFQWYRLRFACRALAGGIRDVLMRDFAGAADNGVKAIMGCGALFGRWSGAYRQRVRFLRGRM